MKNFEYKSIRRDLHDLMSDYKMNSFGRDGWELVSFALGNYSAVYIFKREKPDETLNNQK